MARLSLKDCEVYFCSELKKYGVNEDGEDFIGEVYCIFLENKKGDRWVHRSRFDGVKVEQWEEGPVFRDIRPESRETCQNLVDAINKVGSVDLTYWTETYPAYGSEAFQEYGNEELIEWEKAMG
jgi:hypothetical protein